MAWELGVRGVEQLARSPPRAPQEKRHALGADGKGASFAIADVIGQTQTNARELPLPRRLFPPRAREVGGLQADCANHLEAITCRQREPQMTSLHARAEDDIDEAEPNGDRVQHVDARAVVAAYVFGAAFLERQATDPEPAAKKEKSE